MLSFLKTFLFVNTLLIGFFVFSPVFASENCGFIDNTQPKYNLPFTYNNITYHNLISYAYHNLNGSDIVQTWYFNPDSSVTEQSFDTPRVWYAVNFLNTSNVVSVSGYIGNSCSLETFLNYSASVGGNVRGFSDDSGVYDWYLLYNDSTDFDSFILPSYTNVSCSFSFDDIPDWTDPLGMFTGFFSQLFDWFGCAFNGLLSGIYSIFSTIIASISNMFSFLFMPSDTFLDNQIQTLTDFRDSKFPIFSQISSVLDSGFSDVSSGDSEIPTMEISLYNSQDMQIMNKSVLSPYITQFRFWVSMFLWFYCAVFCIRSIHSFFHPGQLKLSI